MEALFAAKSCARRNEFVVRSLFELVSSSTPEAQDEILVARISDLMHDDGEPLTSYTSIVSHVESWDRAVESKLCEMARACVDPRNDVKRRYDSLDRLVTYYRLMKEAHELPLSPMWDEDVFCRSDTRLPSRIRDLKTERQAIHELMHKVLVSDTLPEDADHHGSTETEAVRVETDI